MMKETQLPLPGFERRVLFPWRFDESTRRIVESTRKEVFVTGKPLPVNFGCKSDAEILPPDGKSAAAGKDW